MKNLLLLIFLLVTACTGHYKENDFDLNAVVEAMTEIEKKIAPGQLLFDKSEWPEYLKVLKAKDVHIGKYGIFIELDRFFVEESGLYMPTTDKKPNEGLETDPSFIYLGEGIYSYHRKG